ncbi:MAG TPA: MBL fold metallo-hydrolase, partial [Candidatus Bilamarchaeaceae archaeon]|nr:MBL fold metallo-hydrolase [Candidatus Bilamarchaeaceae archaeon]
MGKMKLQCLGAGQKVGRSCFVLETDQKVMLDCGLKIYEVGEGRDMFPLPFRGRLDAIVLGHAHFDHSGYLPSMFAHGGPDWFSTPPTAEITNLLWADSMKIMGDRSPYTEAEIAKANRKWVGLEYGKRLHLGKTAFRLHDAGHILGAAMVEAEHGGRRFVYTGDFKMEGSRMHAGAEPVKDVDVLVIESTYSSREHPERKGLERKLAEDVAEVIDSGGNALFPAFAVGRTQELISIIRAHNKGVPIFVDGMGKEVTRMCMRNPGYIRDAEEFGEHAESAVFVQGREDRVDATSPARIPRSPRAPRTPPR